MSKVYQALRWLKINQALDYFEKLTGETIDADLLIQFCSERKLAVYINVPPTGIEGKTSDTKECLTLHGVQQVLNPDMAFLDDAEYTCGIIRHNTAHWLGLLPKRVRTPLFKAADIKQLASWISESSAPNAADGIPVEKPLHPSERRSAGQIIAVLAAMSGLDLSKPYTPVESMRQVAATRGLELPRSDDTIVKFLKLAPPKPDPNDPN